MEAGKAIVNRDRIISYVVRVKTEPKIGKVSPSISVAKKLEQLIPELEPSTPVLFQAGTGAGKTRAILDVLVDYAIEHGLKIIFVSSRCAINTQFKRRLARKVGQEQILADYTEAGLQKLEQIGPVQVMTYHALWYRPPAVETADFLVFDEVHALALDASFVAFTGELLNNIPRRFAKCRRIYLSATPEPILDELIAAEGSRRLTIFRWKQDYSPYRLHFYEKQADLVARFKVLPKGEKALIFTSSIRAGESLLKSLPQGGELICAQTRTDDPERWGRLLAEQRLDKQITVVTNTLDAGVSLEDPELKHVVCSGLDIAEVLQQAGRKRLKSDDNKINLYLWSPGRQRLNQLRYRNIELMERMLLCDEGQREFVDRYILGDECPELRSMCYQDKERFFRINGLMYAEVLRREKLLEKLLASKADFPADAYFCRCMGQKLPGDASRWLDGRYSTDHASELLNWLKEQSGRLLDKKAQTEFSTHFKALHRAAFGPRKNDRSDRVWRLAVIKTVLQELNWGFVMESKAGVWQICEVRAQLEAKNMEVEE